MCGCDRLKLAADHTRKHATRSDSERHGSRVAGPRRLPKARMTSIIDLCYPGKVEADGPRSDCDLSLNGLGRNVTCLFNQSTMEPNRYTTRAPLNVQMELHTPRIPADLVAATTMCITAWPLVRQSVCRPRHEPLLWDRQPVDRRRIGEQQAALVVALDGQYAGRMVVGDRLGADVVATGVEHQLTDFSGVPSAEEEGAVRPRTERARRAEACSRGADRVAYHARGKIGDGPSWFVFLGAFGGTVQTACAPQPKFAPRTSRFTSSLHAGPLSASHRRLVSGSNAMPSVFRTP